VYGKQIAGLDQAGIRHRRYTVLQCNLSCAKNKGILPSGTLSQTVNVADISAFRYGIMDRRK